MTIWKRETNAVNSADWLVESYVFEHGMPFTAGIISGTKTDSSESVYAVAISTDGRSILENRDYTVYAVKETKEKAQETLERGKSIAEATRDNIPNVKSLEEVVLDEVADEDLSTSYRFKSVEESDLNPENEHCSNCNSVLTQQRFAAYLVDGEPEQFYCGRCHPFSLHDIDNEKSTGEHILVTADSNGEIFVIDWYMDDDSERDI